MMIPFSASGRFAELDGKNRAPLKASKAMLAVMKPNRLFTLYLYILYRTNLRAQTTTKAFIIDPIFRIRREYFRHEFFVNK
jgi:hypothetical protein